MIMVYFVYHKMDTAVGSREKPFTDIIQLRFYFIKEQRSECKKK